MLQSGATVVSALYGTGQVVALGPALGRAAARDDVTAAAYVSALGFDPGCQRRILDGLSRPISERRQSA